MIGMDALWYSSHMPEIPLEIPCMCRGMCIVLDPLARSHSID